MAKVTKQETAVVTTTYKLEMDADEASAILALVSSVTGSAASTPRKFTRQVYNALTEAGVSNKFYPLVIKSSEFTVNSL